jgi:hypothetical protein
LFIDTPRKGDRKRFVAVQCRVGQALIVSCAYGGSWLTSRQLESANPEDQGQPDQRSGFLHIAYNEMLAGGPVKSVDEALARVEAILRSDAKVPAYTLVAAIRIHGSISPEPKRRVPLLFPAV